MDFSMDIGALIGTIIAGAGIIWQMQRNRFNDYLALLASKEHFEARGRIFSRFCELNGEDLPAQFHKLINNDSNLKKDCDLEIALYERGGYSLPSMPWLKNAALSYAPNSNVLLWIILSNYIKSRRKNYSYDWARKFLWLTYKSIKKVIKRNKKNGIALFDKNGNEYKRFYEKDLITIKSEIRKEIKQKFQIENNNLTTASS